MPAVLHLTGPVLVGADDVRAQAWVVGGRLTYAAPAGDHDVTSVPGWVLPGLVDAHSHIGLGAHGAVDEATAEQQALDDLAAGALLLRDAGSPADTRWVQGRADLPRLVRAGRHIAHQKRRAIDVEQLRMRWYAGEDQGGFDISQKRAYIREALHAVIVHPAKVGRAKFNPDLLEPVWRED